MSSTGTEPTRHPRRARTEQAARIVAVLLALVAVAAVTAAWLVQRASADKRAAVQHQVPAALTTTSPAPLPQPSSSSARVTARPTTKVITAKATPRPAPKPIIAPLVPQHLYVPAISVNTTVAPKPTEMALDPFLHKQVPSFGVPDDMYSTTWWSSGPKPGEDGMAVILGHTQIGGYGVFNNLARLEHGDVVGVQHGSTTLKFQVIAVRTGISKTDPNALSRVLAAHPADARLALLTCSGTFNEGYRASAENTVVFARLVSVSR